MDTEKLHDRYCKICNDFIAAFEEKQNIEFDGWVADEVGDIASFACQYFFNLSDIILDLTTKQPKGKIFSWQDDGLDFNRFKKNPQYINYKSYTMGLRHKDLKEE